MLSAILSILGSSAFGSILGGVFAFLNRKTDLQAKKLDLEHEARRWGHELAVKDKDLEYAKLEAQGRKEVAIVEGEAAMETSRFQAIAAVQAAETVSAEELKAAGKLRWLLVLGMAFNRWVRPIATVVLAGAAISINLLLVEKLTEGWPTLTPEQRFDSAMQAFAWLTGQASAALGYWFVARGSSGNK
jgi:hypothetical protein